MKKNSRKNLLIITGGITAVILIIVFVLYFMHEKGNKPVNTPEEKVSESETHSEIEPVEIIKAHDHQFETVYPSYSCNGVGETVISCSCGAILERLPAGTVPHNPKWVMVNGSEENGKHTEALVCMTCGEILETRQNLNSEYGDGVKKRLVIPSVGINVGLTDSSSQEAADKKDSAAYFPAGENMVIADHNYQQFKVLFDVKVGDEAYIEIGDVRQNYICTEIHEGYRSSNNIYTEDGRSLLNDYSNCLMVYTCIGYAKEHKAFTAVFEEQ